LGRPKKVSKAQVERLKSILTGFETMKNFYSGLGNDHFVIHGKEMANLCDLLIELTKTIEGAASPSKIS
jgi:hypothetical protein